MRIGDAASQVGVPAHRLRHYEASGLLVPDRSRAGYREYTPAHVARAEQIKALLDAGFNTGDITVMMPCLEPNPDDDRKCCSVTRARLTERLHEVRQRRLQLQKTEAAIASWLDSPPDPSIESTR